MRGSRTPDRPEVAGNLHLVDAERDRGEDSAGAGRQEESVRAVHSRRPGRELTYDELSKRHDDLARRSAIMAIERNFVLARMKRVVSETGSMADCARMFIVVESLVAIDP